LLLPGQSSSVTTAVLCVRWVYSGDVTAPKKTSDGKKRSDFAISGGRFPLNTKGRAEIAPKDAASARKAGSITKAQEKTIDRKAAAVRKKK